MFICMIVVGLSGTDNVGERRKRMLDHITLASSLGYCEHANSNEGPMKSMIGKCDHSVAQEQYSWRAALIFSTMKPLPFKPYSSAEKCNVRNEIESQR